MRTNKLMTIAFLAVAFITAAFFGCDNRTFEADTFVIEWISGPDSLYSNVESEIKVLVVNKNTNVPAPNETVTFKLSDDFRSDKVEIQSAATTNEFGVATAKLSHTLSEERRIKVVAKIHQSHVETPDFIRLLEHPGEFVIRKLEALPPVIYNDRGRTRSSIRALVVDSEGTGVQGETVRFRSYKETDPSNTLGAVTSTALTDSTGIARATFNDNGDLGMAVVVASIDHSKEEVNVEIKDRSLLELDLTLRAHPERIYSDNNVSVSTITARVRDSDGFPVSGETVEFRTTLGDIGARVVTNERGLAVTELGDGGDEGVAEITARVEDIEKTVNVHIDPVPEVANVAFGDVPPVVSLEGVFNITATAVDSAGVGLVKGSIMVLETTRGGFDLGEDEGTVRTMFLETDDQGTVSAQWNSGTTAGDVEFRAYILGTEPRAHAASYIRPGEPERITMTSIVRLAGETYWRRMPGAIPVDFIDRNNRVEVIAMVVDAFDNPVQEGIPIRFQTDLGSIQPLRDTRNFIRNWYDEALDEVVEREFKGAASSQFTIGNHAGTATLSASTIDEEIIGYTTIRVESYEVQSIQFVHPEEDEDDDNGDDFEVFLDVEGTGGRVAANLMVHLKDFSGNLISNPADGSNPPNVEFEILVNPGGARLNNIGEQVTVRSNDGVAQVTVNSGRESGTVVLKASLQDNPDIFAVKSNIIIRSGPPHSIIPFMTGFDEGTAVPGGMWRIQVGAVVKDVQGNEVIRGTTVHFSLVGDYPDDTEIIGGAYVGNESDEEEDGDDGVAYTHLFYHGRDTNTPITIRARTGGGVPGDPNQGRIVEQDITRKLPLQQPSLELGVGVGQIRFFAGHIDIHYQEVQAALSDGQGNMIKNQKITITASEGDIVRHGLAQNDFEGSLPSIAITHGDPGFPPITNQHCPRRHDDLPYDLPDDTRPNNLQEYRAPHTLEPERGIAYAIARANRDLLPPPGEEPFIATGVELTGRILGTDTISQTSFIIIRYNPMFFPNPF